MVKEFLQYGSIGLIAAIFAITIIVIDKRLNNLYRKLEKEKDKQIAELEKRVDKFEEKELQRLRDVHEIMTDLNKSVAALVDTSKGFREMVNLISDKLS